MIKMQRPTRPRIHSGPVNAMFDDTDDLFHSVGAHDNQLPPPPFIVAGSAAIATAAATLSLTDTAVSSTAASERSIPIYQPPLRQRIAGFYERHTKLTAKLEDLGDIPAQLESVQHEIYSTTGKVKAQEARLKTLQTISQEKQESYARMGSTFAKRMMNKRGSRSRALLQAQEEVKKAASLQTAHELELESNRSMLASQQARARELERDLIEHSAMSNELDKVDRMLFDGATPEFPQDDVAEWEVRVLAQVETFMAAEANREKRARQMLKDATPLITSVIKDIQTALQYCIASGVASNKKYVNQLTTSNTAKSTVRGTQPLVLKAKTNSGKLFTTIAKARGSQMLVERPPDFRLIELHLMPESKNPKAVDERGLHKSLETSYAQAKAVDSYLKREIAASVERQKKLVMETAKMQDTIKDAHQRLRRTRRDIIVSVVQEDNHKQTSMQFALPLQDKANPMISAQFQENLRKEALNRLRQLIALPDPESEDDNMYPVIA